MNADALAAVNPALVQSDVAAVLDAVRAVVEEVPATILAHPTGCAEWNVRTLLNHMVFENLAHVALATGGPMPEPDADYLGDDHVTAFQVSAEQARTALTDPALLQRTFGTQEAPGSFVVQMLVNEQLTHGWDLARATGQSTDLVPATAERALPAARAFYGDVPRSDTTYHAEQPVPPDATAADRLAAYLGRG
ncbi:MAG: TIGR03086 family metal-binding protein [Pseudonocardiaceae bacterium]